MTTLNGKELLQVIGITNTGLPSGETLICTTQDIANLGGGGSAAAINVFTPEQFGGKGNTVGQNDGVISGGSFNQFSSPTFVFTSSYVGSFLWFDTTDRTITSVSAGIATFSPAASGAATGVQWVAGADDTVAIQAALDAAAAVQGDTVENAGGINGLIMSGGVCQLAAGKAYTISNSQASYTGGKLSCLQVTRRTDFRGSGVAAWRSALVLRPNSYGHMISTHQPTSPSLDFVDFVAIGNMALYGYQAWSPNALDGIYWVVDFNGYDSGDTFNRFYDISVNRATQNGFTFGGRGETLMDRLQSTNNGQYGFNIGGQSDYSMTECNAGGNNLTGFRIHSSGGQYINCKSYFNGAGGGTDDDNSANWAITADQMLNGGVNCVGCSGQESRGSSWVIDNAGLCSFSNCEGLDPGRISGNLGNGTVPTVCAGIYIKNAGGCQNLFDNFYVGPSVANFLSNNWGQATNCVQIDGVDGNGSGPQLNAGTIFTFQPTINGGGGYDPGIKFRPGFGYTGGAGFTNGRNTQLYVNGIAGAPVIPGQVKDLVASASFNQIILNWNIYFKGGIAITSYLVEYKATASPTWLTFGSPVTVQTATVTGLTNGTSYDFRVSATNSVGTGPVSTTTTATPAGTLLAAIPSNLMDLTCADTGSYSGTGQTWHNLTTAPADGSLQTAYDFFLGTTGSAEAEDPTFSGTPGSGSAFFTGSGAQWFTMANGNTTVINNVQKTTGGNPFTIAMLISVPARTSGTSPWAFAGDSGNNTSTDGFAVRNGDFSLNVNKLELTCSTTFGSFTAEAQLPTLADVSDGTYKLIVATYDASTRTLKGYVGNNTPASGSVSFYTSATNPTNTMQLFAQGAGQLPCGSGWKALSISMFNSILTDSQVAILESFYSSRHGISV